MPIDCKAVYDTQSKESKYFEKYNKKNQLGNKFSRVQHTSSTILLSCGDYSLVSALSLCFTITRVIKSPSWQDADIKKD